MHTLMGAVSRRTAGLAAAAVLAGGMAGGVLLLPGTAFATPLINTATAITNVTQSSGASGTTLDVFVTVTPVGGSAYPTGTVTVTDGIGGSGCNIHLAQDGPGSSVATGSCDIAPPLSAGTYTLHASYLGDFTFGGSFSSTDTMTIGSVPVFTADSPSLTANHGGYYGYTFAASGNPAPSYALGSGAPGWLSINSSTGALSGTVPSGISSFTYSVVASNGQGSATAGPFTVTIGYRGGRPGGHASLYTSLRCTSPVRSGSHGTCTLYVTNTGSRTAQDVTAKISFPSQLTADFCGHNWGHGWFDNWGCSISGNTATENLGSLNPGQSKSLTVTFTAQSTRWLWGWGRQFEQRVTVVGSASAQSQGFWGWSGGGSTSYSVAHVAILPQRFFL